MKTVFLGGILFFAVYSTVFSQSLEEVPGLRERAVIMHIASRIVENNEEVWNSENSQITIPGRPVGVKLLGNDLVVAVQFTPYIRRNGRHTLVAQGQIWMNIPNEGISYRTSIQTIPLQFHEEIFFFPLGSGRVPNEARIEIRIVLEPYAGRERPYRRGRQEDSGNEPAL